MTFPVKEYYLVLKDNCYLVSGSKEHVDKQLCEENINPMRLQVYTIKYDEIGGGRLPVKHTTVWFSVD